MWAVALLKRSRQASSILQGAEMVVSRHCCTRLLWSAGCILWECCHSSWLVAAVQALHLSCKQMSLLAFNTS
jgi:hypothetical protein